jgi:glycosyltransferase involved in cell wall biosynthesis
MKASDSQRCDVLFLIRSMGRGGAERQLSLLARSLQTRGLLVAVAVLYAGGAIEHELHAAGVEVVDLRKRGRWSNLAMLWRLVVAIQRKRPRVLHAYMSTQNAIALLLRPWLVKKKCAVVCGIRIANLDTHAYGVVKTLVHRAQGYLLHSADCVISNSRAALIQLNSNLPEMGGYAIPNGVEATHFVFDESKRLNLRSELGLRDGVIALGLVGRLDPQKNHVQLLEALAIIDKFIGRVVIVFVGDGSIEYRESVSNHACQLGLGSRVVWVGPMDDMSAVYSALDVLCLCSVSEGFPNVLAEAMCAGLPCVATDVGDAALLVGECGWVVPPRDTQALAHALLEAFRALPGWNREHPRRRMVEEFSVDALADRTLVALKPFLGEVAP